MKAIDVCPGTLAPGFDTYSPLCLRRVFEGKKVSHIMDFSLNDDTKDDVVASINKISISGVQEKLSAIIKKGKIIVTPDGESGRYIIKPIPDYKSLRFRNNIPANEHLTMQIASQVYKINTAENALAFFEMARYNKQVSRGCGGIGRRARFRFWWETVGVRVPSPA